MERFGDGGDPKHPWFAHIVRLPVDVYDGINMLHKYLGYCLHLTVLFLAVGCGQTRMIRPEQAGAIADGGKAAVSPESKSGGEVRDPAAGGEGMFAVEVVHVGGRPGHGAVVLLQEKGGERRIMPMVIGESEGNAISLRVSRQKSVRPLTHDLLESILREYGLKVVKLEIDDLKSGIFLGRLFLMDAKGDVSELDTRPSDGIALALGANAPIFMSLGVIESTGRSPSEWESESSSDDDEPEEGAIQEML